MTHSTHERIAMAQQVLEQLNSLTGLGGEGVQVIQSNWSSLHRACRPGWLWGCL
ncbi:hypothetical protein [Deinococcus sp. NW-56]|uniref:hypothetical protein n=1 Tax=Deinococcus sp. NW-56 TaxID=2080419 RepID=UPI00131A39F0|nr:hypothetical protein [Deinococcus sp. NW-56]